MFRIASVLIAATLLSASAARAQAPTPPPLDIYGRLPAFELASLSADGERLALVTTEGEQRLMLIHTVPGGVILGGARIGDAKVRDLSWVGDGHVLAVTSSTQRLPTGDQAELSFGQVYSLETRRITSVFERLPGVLRILYSFGAYRIDGQPRVVIEAQSGDDYNLDLYAIDPVSMNPRRLEENARNTRGYVLSADGRRLVRYSYREETGLWALQAKQPNGLWTTIWSTTALLDRPVIGGEGPDGDSVTIFAKPDEASAKVWRLMGLDGTWRPLPFEGEPDSLIYHPATGRLIGAAWREAEGWRYEFSDPAAARVWRSIGRAFEGRNPQLASWSDDLRQAIVFTSNSTDAGTFSFVDLDAGRADVLGEQYPQITADQVGEVRPISYPAADGLTIPGYLTLPPGVTDPQGLPLVVLPHGGPAVRDELQFDWWAQALASRGYAVLQPNFRGSSGLGQAHLEAGYGEWGRKMQTDLSDGVRYLATQGVIDPARVCIVGASYGGYAALAGATLDPGIYRCAVSVAGVSDLRAMLRWTEDRMGQNANAANRYWNRFMGARNASDQSLDARSPVLLAAQADASILLIHGRDDTVVPFSQSTAMAAALRGAGKPVELVELDGEDHWLSRADTRQRMLSATVAFIEANNPAN
ncbi:alpha/beta hydrolase family protein [Brevundimonas subvibrioides]|uniref:S9 family peptidase n=1 Tax=Brevundimonas subvibrioides TaxID=74313 RepID=UPI0022B55495|nr:S9 family peptidase [Brevundimonas subvibrioides]